MSEPKQTLRNTLRQTARMIGFIWRADSGKAYILAKLFDQLINTAMNLSFVVFPGLLINELVREETRVSLIVLFIGVITLVPLVRELWSWLFGDLFITKLSNQVNVAIRSKYLHQVVRMDYETLENPEEQVKNSRAGEMLIHAKENAVGGVMRLFSSIITLLTLTALVASINPLFILLVVTLIFVKSIVLKWANKKRYDIGYEQSTVERSRQAYMQVVTSIPNGKEIRIFGFKDMIIGKFMETLRKLNHLNIKSAKLRGLPGIFAQTTAAIQSIAVYSYLAVQVVRGVLSIGDMTIFIAAISQFTGAVEGISGAYLSMSYNTLYITEIFNFFEAPVKQEESGDQIPTFDKNGTFEFRNVSFKYPGSDRYALENVNITFSSGKKLAILGPNGAGKSTFIKLLTRLYFPTSGTILYNGMDINSFDYTAYQKLFSPVFQDFGMYPLTVAENIILGNLRDNAKLDEVCHQAGLTALIAKLPKGYETMANKQLDPEGFTPSGGEGQRIAIARALYHNSPIYLLDEPTAALDPLMEHEIYSRFSQMVTDNMSIFITHRLSAVKLVDEILVIDNGRIAEHGTHDQLYKDNGQYREMYDKQAEFYIR